MPFAFFRVTVVTVLLAAAALKLRELRIASMGDHGSFKSVALLTITIEFALAWWMLSGLGRRSASVVGFGVFTVFACASLVKAVKGAPSCGCFGGLSISPWFTFAFDATAAAGMLLLYRGTPSARLRLRPTLSLSLSGAACLGALVIAAQAGRPAAISSSGVILGTSHDVVLVPEQWRGKRFPLADKIDLGDQTMHGRWTVLLYRDDCPACGDALQSRKQNMSRANRGEDERYAAVCVPPSHSNPSDTAGWIAGNLAADRNWLVATPVWMRLRDGIVSEVEAPSAAAQPTTASALSKTVLQPGDGSAGELVFDLGFVNPDSSETYKVAVPNRSSKAINLRGFVSECSCTTVVDAPKILPAHADTPLEIRFAAPKEPTLYSKRITLRTDKVSDASITMLLRARVGLPLWASPDQLEMGKLKVGEGVTASIVLRNDGEQPVKLLYSTCDHADSLLKIPREAVPVGGSLRLELSVRPTGDAGSDQHRLLHVHTSVPGQSIFDIPVRYRTEP